jgi:hypothetical protein
VLMAWLDMLERSAMADHDVAAFVLSHVLHRSNSSADNVNSARRWLRKVKGDEAGPVVNVMWKMRYVHGVSNRPCSCCRWFENAKVAVSTQHGKIGRSTLCSAARSVGSAMSVIGSSYQCSRFCADQC